jgi:transcriptional regulator with XRE-family HTH domain
VLKVKAERLRKSWNQTALAFYAGMSVGDISRIESGRMKPYPLQLEKLSNVLQVPPDELLKDLSPETERALA